MKHLGRARRSRATTKFRLALVCLTFLAIELPRTVLANTTIDISCYISKKSQQSKAAQPDWQAIAKDYASNKVRTGCNANPSERAEQSRQANARQITGNVSVNPSPQTASPRSDFVWLVRKDLADVGLFSKPTANADAEGAELSWSRNNITRDTIWQVDGLFAVAYSYVNQDYSPFIGITVAPYLKVNRELHSALSAADNNADTITVGGSGEIGFNMPKRGANYFRAHWSETEDHIANARLSQAGLEWIPTYLRLHRQIPGTYVTYNLNPELRVDYDRRSDGLMPVGFSGLNQSLRVGPQIKFLARATDFGQTLPDWAQPLLSFRGSMTIGGQRSIPERPEAGSTHRWGTIWTKVGTSLSHSATREDATKKARNLPISSRSL